MTKMGQAAIFETRGNRRLPRHPARRQARRTTTPTSVAAACAALRAAGLREQVMIDVSHGNSEKQHRRQIEIAADDRRRASPPASGASPA